MQIAGDGALFLTYLIAAEMIPQNWIHFHGYALLLLAWAGEIKYSDRRDLQKTFSWYCIARRIC